MMLSLSIELAALVALLAIPALQPDLGGRRLLRLAVLLWGTTAFGAIHTFAEYLVMVKFSDANWDCPPGTGYLTVATITISANLTAIMTLPYQRAVPTISRMRTVIQGRLPSPERQHSLIDRAADRLRLGVVSGLFACGPSGRHGKTSQPTPASSIAASITSGPPAGPGREPQAR